MTPRPMSAGPTRPGRAAWAQDSDIFIDLRDRGGRGRSADGAVRDAAYETIRERKRKPIWIDLNQFSLDGAYAFCLFVAMLFVQQAGTLSGAVMATLPLLYMASRRRLAKEVLRTRWILLAAPAFAVASAIWSEAPGVSAKYGVEMLLTAAAGIGLSAALRPTAVIKGACLAFAAYIGVSLAFGRSALFSDGGATAQAFVGLGDGKNLLADIASTGALLSLTTLLIGLRQHKALWAFLGLCAMAVEIYIMVMARSAGAALALGAAAAGFLFLVLLASLPRALRICAAGLALVSTAILALAIRDILGLLMGYGAQLFDKDPTLTGRTYLWYRAQDLIAEKPWLGRGFYAFWRQGNIDAEGLWQYAGISGRSGFNFHNALVELTVQLGLVGAAVFCLVGLIALLALARRFIERPTLPVCFWLTYMLYEAVRAPVEAIGYAPFYFSTCLLFAAGGVGLQRLPRRVRLPRRFQPQAERIQPRPSRRHRGEAVAGAS